MSSDSAASSAAPAAPDAADAAAVDRSVHELLQRLRVRESSAPLGSEQLRAILRDLRRLLLDAPSAAAAADAASAAADDELQTAEQGDPPRTDASTAAETSSSSAADVEPPMPPALEHFVRSQQYASFCSALWRADVVSHIAQWDLSDLGDLFFVWFDSPLPASEALLALSAAARSTQPAPIDAPLSSSLAAVHALLASTFQRWMELQMRAGEMMRELCEHEASRSRGARGAGQLKSVPASTASSASLSLSPHGQSLIDALVGAPNVLANVVGHKRLPYALGSRAWNEAIVAQLAALLQDLAQRRTSATFVRPMGSLLAKLARVVSAADLQPLLDGLLDPLLAHLHQLQTDSGVASPASSSPFSPSTPSSSILVPSSPLLSLYASLAQSVGVQAMESVFVALLRWIGARLPRTPSHSGNDSDAAQLEATLLAALPALFPLDFYRSSPFFTLLPRRLLSKAALPFGATRALVAYVAWISARDEEQKRNTVGQAPPADQSILQQLLLSLAQQWSGGESSSAGSSAVVAASGESSLALTRSIELLLLAVERAQPGFDPRMVEAARERRRQKKQKGGEKTNAAEEEREIHSLDSFVHSPVLPFLLGGIHSRLSSPVSGVRRATMRAARVLSRLMGGPENEIDFGGEDEEDPSARAGDSEDEEEETDEQRRAKSAAQSLTPATIINAEHLARATLNLPSASASGAPLQSYSLADDERDLRKVRPPSFLRDALDMLQRHADSAEHVEAALEALPSLIARHPADLAPLATSLCASLLNVGSSVFVESDSKLARWRRDALVALCASVRGSDARVASASVSYLQSQVFGEGHSLGAKIELLDILRVAAEQLAQMDGSALQPSASSGALGSTSARPLVQEVQTVTPLAHQPLTPAFYSASSGTQAVSETLAQQREIVRARVESRTKRWGSAAAKSQSAAPARVYSVNRFTPLAPLFFYPLMRRIDDPALLPLLAQHDSLLHLRLLHTVSCFIPCSSGLSQSLPLTTRHMCRTLLEYLLVSAQRVSRGGSGSGAAVEQVAMRRMIFFALSRILVTYNERLFADDFSRELPELVSWLSDSVQNDRDGECRQLAGACLHFLKQLLGNPFESMFKREENEASYAAVTASQQLPQLKF